MSAEGTESLEVQRLPSHLLRAFGYVEGTSHRKCIAEEEWQLLTASQALPTAVKASQLNLTSHSQRSCSPRMRFKEKKKATRFSQIPVLYPAHSPISRSGLATLGTFLCLPHMLLCLPECTTWSSTVTEGTYLWSYKHISTFTSNHIFRIWP